MERSYEEKYHRLEEAHWWFRARRELIAAMIRKASLPKFAGILEIGCSGGPLMIHLREQGYTDIHGIDISSHAIDLAKSRGVANVQVMDAAKLDFPDQRFDLATASDVLEHIEDDSGALQHWHRVLRPEGRVIIFVPAFQSLFGGHDIVNHHFRRYRASQLAAKMRAAGFDVIRTGYWNFGLFFPVGGMRLLARMLPKRKDGKLPSDQLVEVNPFVNISLLTMLRMENAATKAGLNWPVGVSTYAIGVRRG